MGLVEGQALRLALLDSVSTVSLRLQRPHLIDTLGNTQQANLLLPRRFQFRPNQKLLGQSLDQR